MDSPASPHAETPFGPVPIDGDALIANVLRFARLLRRAGLDIETGQTATFLRAVLLVGLDRRERYSRFMLRFAHELQWSGAPLEVFVFGTRLTRITRQLRLRSPDAALRRVSSSPRRAWRRSRRLPRGSATCKEFGKCEIC